MTHPVARRTFVIEPALAGRRLDRALHALLTGSGDEGGAAAPTRAAVQRLVVRGAVTVDGRVERRPSAVVAAGARVACRLPAAGTGGDRPAPVAPVAPDPDALAARVLYEDGWLLAIDKPAGLPTHATIDPARPHLVGAVQAMLAARGGEAPPPDAPYVGVHHRLDVDTSGVVVFSTHRDANAGLARSFAEREARKVYLAVAADAGRPSRRIGERWTVRNHLGRISDRRERARYGPVRSGGDRAETTFTLLERRPGRRVLLQAEPHTGRSHQIRVHAAGAGLPLVGDVLYGGPPAARVLLHARALSLPHPVTGAELVLEAPLPAELT